MSDLCQICEENLPFIICLTCRDPRSMKDISTDGEISDGSGVMICKECINLNHNRGFFLRHVTEDAVQHQQMHIKERLKNDVETLKKEALQKIDWKLSTFKNSTLKVKSREEACKRQVNQQLRVLYNRAVSMLTSKEEDMNKQISTLVEDFSSKKEKEGEDLKEFSSSLSSKFDKIMEMFESEEYSEAEAHTWIGEAKKEIEGKLVEADDFSCGPYFNINLDSLEEDAPLNINALKICDVNFRCTKDLWKEEITTALQEKLEEGYELEIKRPLKPMVSFSTRDPSRLFVHIPHPIVIKHGVWIVDLLEAHLNEENHNGNLKPIEDYSASMNSGQIIGHVKYNSKSGCKEINRCVLTSLRRMANGGTETTVVYLDRDRPKSCSDTKTMLLVKLDDFSFNLPSLRVKLSFNNNMDTRRTYFPEMSMPWRKQLESRVDKGKVMKITFVQQIDLGWNPPDYLWAAKLVLDDVSLNDLIEKEQADVGLYRDLSREAGKGSIVPMCRDIRMLNNGRNGLTVVRDNAAASDSSSKEPSTEEKSKSSASTDNAKNVPVVIDVKSLEEQDEATANEEEDTTTSTISSSVNPSTSADTTTTKSSSLSADYTEAEINQLVESSSVMTAESSTNLPQDNQLIENQTFPPELYQMMIPTAAGFVGSRDGLLPTPLHQGAGDHMSQQQIMVQMAVMEEDQQIMAAMEEQQQLIKQNILQFFPPPQMGSPGIPEREGLLTSQQIDEQLTACCVESINNSVTQLQQEILEQTSNEGAYMNVGNGDHSSNEMMAMDKMTTSSSAIAQNGAQALMKIDTLSIASSDHNPQQRNQNGSSTGGERDQSPASSVSSAPSYFKPPPANMRRNSFRNNKQHRIGRGDSRGGQLRYSMRGRSCDDNSQFRCWNCNRRGHAERDCLTKPKRRPSRNRKVLS